MSKNTRNRILLTAVAALLLVVMTVGGTLAWPQDTSDTVENTFTASNIDIELDEIQDTNQDNKESFQMIPGATIAKQPYVTVTNNDTDAWVIIEVVESTNLDDFISYTVDSALWQPVPDHEGFYYTSVAKEFNNTIDILTGDQVTVLPTVTKEDMATMTNPTLSFKAYVIQKDATNIATIEAAWAALFPTT